MTHVASRTGWRFHGSTRDAWDALGRALDDAEESIDFEQYIVTTGTVGTRFLEKLKRAARRGVRVRVLLDFWGSRSVHGSDWPRRLRAAGAEVRFFNPMTPRTLHRLHRWPRRDHRKVVLIDARRAFAGGVGLADRMAEWRDILVEIEGPVTEAIAVAFAESWSHCGGGPAGHEGTVPVAPRADFTFVANIQRSNRSLIYEYLIANIDRAEHRVRLVTPYFIPDRRLLGRLADAVRRGVEVSLIVPARSDRWFVDAVARTHYGKALDAGVRVFEYGPEMIHAKAVSVDGRWVTVGSCNLDYLSFFTNFEANLISCQPRFVRDAEAGFERDLDRATELSRAAWRARPMTVKAAGRLGRAVKKML